jgi:membrane-anchored protein YejM (alkaline phosphatase superfamily)
LVDVNQARERQLAGRMTRGMRGQQALDYPLSPLLCDNPQPANLLVILLDAWRFDMFSPELTPRLDTWARRNAVRFTRHFSGGNSSRMGVFTFFYGLPPSYFDSFEAVQQPALLVSQAQRQGYAMGLYTSSSMYRPVTLDRTAFASVPGLRVTPLRPGAPAWQRDRDLLEEWAAFLDARGEGQPFFGFLLFDATNSMSVPPDMESSIEAQAGMDPRFARYRAATRYLDTLVGDVLDDLAARGLDEDTAVLISADHGEEFGESGDAFRMHGSGYSRYQLQVPLLLSLPGVAPGVVDARTSHYDVAPTLLGRVLGCNNDPVDYSAGADLLTRPDWDWLIAGSYYNYAVLEPDRVTVTFPNGLFEVRDADYQPITAPQIDAGVLQDVMRENRRFHR